MIRAITAFILFAAVTFTSGCVCTAPFQGIWCTAEPSEQVTPSTAPSAGNDGGGGSSSTSPGL